MPILAKKRVSIYTGWAVEGTLDGNLDGTRTRMGVKLLRLSRMLLFCFQYLLAGYEPLNAFLHR